MAATNIITLDLGETFIEKVAKIQSFFISEGISLNPIGKCNITLAAVADPRPVSERNSSEYWESVQNAINDAFRSVTLSKVDFGELHRERSLTQMKVLNEEYISEIRCKVLDVLIEKFGITPVEGHYSAKVIIARSNKGWPDEEASRIIDEYRQNVSAADSFSFVPVGVTWKILNKSPRQLMSHNISLPFSANERVEEIQKVLSSFKPEISNIVLGALYVKEGDQFPEKQVEDIINEVVPRGLEVTLDGVSLSKGKVMLDLCSGSAQKLIDLRDELFRRLDIIGVMPVDKFLRLKIPILDRVPVNVDEDAVAAVAGANDWRRLTEPISLTSPGAILKKFSSSSKTMKTHYVSSELSEDSKEGIAKAVGSGLRMVNHLHFTWGVYRFNDSVTTEDAVNCELKDFFNNNVKGLVFRFGEFGSFGNSITYISVTERDVLNSIREKLDRFLGDRGIVCVDSRFTPHVTVSREPSLSLSKLGRVENIPPSPVLSLSIKKLVN